MQGGSGLFLACSGVKIRVVQGLFGAWETDEKQLFSHFVGLCITCAD